MITISQRAEQAIKNMMEYVHKTTDKEPVVIVDLGTVPETDTLQCMVSFGFKKDMPPECVIVINEIPIVIDSDIKGMLDYENGGFAIK